MLDTQLLLYFVSAIFFCGWFFENRHARRSEKQLNATRSMATSEIAQLTQALADKNSTLAGEYLNKKKATDLLDALRSEADGAKARMIQLNDALNTERELHEKTKKENGTLVEEVVRLNGEIDKHRSEIEVLEAHRNFLRKVADESAKVSLKKVKKVAKKSEKKRG